MEGSHDERISVVYYCGGAEDDVCELYHDNSPPQRASRSEHGDDALHIVHGNIRSLLDEDQGGFSEGASSLRSVHDSSCANLV